MNQMILPLDLEFKLQENDIAFHIHHLVESIPEEAFIPFLRNEGCPAYHPRMMLKIILCGYTQSAFSGRKIEELLKDSVRMMWLARGMNQVIGQLIDSVYIQQLKNYYANALYNFVANS